MQPRHLPLKDLIHRGIQHNLGEVNLLIECLGMADQVDLSTQNQSQQHAEIITKELRLAGSHTFATIARGGEGVEYSEIVRDTAKLLKIKTINERNTVVEIEEKIIETTFERALDKMTEDERLELLQEMGVPAIDLPTSAGMSAAVVMSMLAKRYGALWLLKSSPWLVNTIGLTLAGQGGRVIAAGVMGKGIALLSGPIGWAIAGGLIANDLAGPAKRKTIPAVILVAALRQRVMKVMNLGVVGSGSVGKDALFREVFHIDTKNVDALAGSTKEVERYDYDPAKSIRLLNYPGFNDYRDDVRAHVEDIIPVTDLFICVVDVNRGITQVDIDIVNKVSNLNRPLAICLNKTDMLRPNDKARVISEAKNRLGEHLYFETAFDPDPRLQQEGPVGGDEVFKWVTISLAERGKDVNELMRVRAEKKEELASA